MTSLIWSGSRKPLTKDDLYDLNPKDTSARVDGWLARFWAEYDSFCDQPDSGSPGLWNSMMSSALKSLYVPSPLDYHIWLIPF